MTLKLAKSESIGWSVVATQEVSQELYNALREAAKLPEDWFDYACRWASILGLTNGTEKPYEHPYFILSY